jgi:MFS transporter, OCT family, solute carrier family 22 (organic cation transporter), member 4/5
MKFDDLYQYTGEIGVYQICVIVFFFAFDLYALDSTTMIFIGAEMPHWCRVEPLSNFSYFQQKYIAIPYEPDGGGQDYSSCKMFELNYSSYSEEELMSWNRSLMVDDTTPTVDCQHWIYEQSTFVSTLASRVNTEAMYYFSYLRLAHNARLKL